MKTVELVIQLANFFTLTLAISNAKIIQPSDFFITNVPIKFEADLIVTVLNL